MTNPRAKIGKKGEQIALEYLKAKGFQILEQNWRHKQDEIDIIAKDDIWLVFVEVKTRSDNAYGNPQDAVDVRKQKALIRAAEAYIAEKKYNDDIRMDIVAIMISPFGDADIEHIEFAFS